MRSKLLLAVLSFAAGAAHAAEPPYPARPLRIIVPQSAGGSTSARCTGRADHR